MIRFRSLPPDTARALTLLQEKDIGPHSRLGLMAPPSAAVDALICAALLTGVTLCPISTAMPETSRQRLIDRLAPDHLWTSLPSLPEFSEKIPEQGSAHGRVCIATSGSSGEPKLVRLSAKNLLTAAAHSVEVLELSPEERWLGCLPWDRIGGYQQRLRACISGGALDSMIFDVHRCAEALAGDCGGVALVPIMLRRLCHYFGTEFPDTTKTILVGGEALDKGLRERCIKMGVTPRESWAATETAALASLDGVPLPGVNLTVSEGRIQVTGMQVAEGYEEDGKLTNPFNGTWQSNDRGRLIDGRLFIEGREDQIFISGGEKVDPDRVRAGLMQHPAVESVELQLEKDPEWGLRLHACLGGKPVAEDDFKAWLRQNLAPAERPKSWEWQGAG